MSVPEPPRPPASQEPRTEALGTSVTSKLPWWQRRWGVASIGVVCLLVGIGIGGASSSSKSSKPAPTPAQLRAQAEARTAQIHREEAEKAATDKARVANEKKEAHERAVQVREAAHKEREEAAQKHHEEQKEQAEATHKTEEETKNYSGNGGENLGTVKIEAESTLEWTNDGSYFGIITSEGVPVNSQAHSGSTVLEPGTYKSFQVNAIGNWTIKIIPK